MRITAILICQLIFLSGVSQKITYNPNIKAEGDYLLIRTVFESYLLSKPDSLYDNPYWIAEEKAQYKQFDLLEGEFQPSLYMGFPVHVLSIGEQKKDRYRLKAQFSYVQQNGSLYVLAIVNYDFIKVNQEFKISNALLENRKAWKHNKVGNINYYHPHEISFDIIKAKEFIKELNSLSQKMQLTIPEVDYYYADSFNEIQRLRGIDFFLGEGGPLNPTGRAIENSIFAAGLGENYLHEGIHVLLYTNFGKIHNFVDEGIATYFGGSRGKNFQWHCENLYTYCQTNSGVNFSNIFQYKQIDNFTSIQRVVAALFFKSILEKGGWPLAIKMIRNVRTDEEYSKFISLHLGIEQQKFGDFIMLQLKSYE